MALRKLFCLGLVASAAAHSNRKSLNFGPRHASPHYVTEPQLVDIYPTSDPYDVARTFISAHTDSSYFIRPDSYTDRNTGITHVYARQLVNGLEVSNGDINLNIRKGYVHSYGDSFFRGNISLASKSAPIVSLETLCADFSTDNLMSGNQQTRFGDSPTVFEELFQGDCVGPLAALREVARLNPQPHSIDDPRWAALYFMIAAHPDPIQVNRFVQNFSSILRGMSLTPNTSLGGSVIFVNNVPGSVSPVKARMMYIHSPGWDDETELNLAWRLEVEMAHNWYEAYVALDEPSKIISAID
ncbi:hypothetical protein RSOLAG22IIIB_10325 [Rhizoctonia solani]|uniref:FTP domain-containing protein n=1 Tax=Rhizoctonia solani TaxID=456999 RepID=A0A0K6G3J6_9AGAM|nr:hypothetical protein RSOLAG22IIIB_10325 [Rhizoctonia solani]